MAGEDERATIPLAGTSMGVDTDAALLTRSLGEGAFPIAKGVAKLYRGDAKGQKWSELHVGLLVWLTDADGFQQFKLLRLADGAVLLEEELYENFDATYKDGKTKNGTHPVHTFEFEDYVAAACFAKEGDANEFKSRMAVMAPKPKHKPGSKECKGKLGP